MLQTTPHHPSRTTASGPRAAAAALQGVPVADMLRWLIVPLLALSVFLMAVDAAEAKRMGGGRSFGSKQSYSQGYAKPAPSKDQAAMQRQAGPGQQAGAKGGFMSKFGGLGGMLGGLVMGGLIGSLLFGGGFGGGIGLLELLLLGLIGFMIFRFIRSRRAGQAAAAGDRYAYAVAGAERSGPAARADGWDSLRQAGSASSVSSAPEASPIMPEGVDQAEFLSGAKALFVRLQASWNRRDLADIRAFTSPEVQAEIERQAAADPTPDRTDILMLEARVLEVRKEGAQTVISVLHDALLREDQSASQPTQVREVWHIRRDESAAKPEWILEGIQQLEV